MMESTVIREDASTESRLLLKQMYGSFGSKTKRKKEREESIPTKHKSR